MRTLLIFISFQNVNCAMDHGIARAGVVPLPGAKSNADSGVGSDTNSNTNSNTKSNNSSDHNRNNTRLYCLRFVH